MKLFFLVFSAFLLFNFRKKPDLIQLTKAVYRNDLPARSDSSQPIRILNNSSLRRVPVVLKDLLIALDESPFTRMSLFNKSGFNIDVDDTVCKHFDVAAIVYKAADTIYHLKLNNHNKQVSDRALAATLIHEIMHCILMDINQRARLGDQNALTIVAGFNLRIKNPFDHSSNDFFNLMNRAEDGQHELIYQLFYPDMVLLLEKFAQIHEHPFWDREEAQYLMWSGLQKTSAYQKLNEEKQTEIVRAILIEKGMAVTLATY